MNRFCQILSILLIGGALSGCQGDSQVKRVDLQRRLPTEQIRTIPPRKSFRVAVAAMLSAQRTFASYRVLLDYLEEPLQMPILFKQRRTYEEVNLLLERDQLDLAFICTGAYVALREKIPVEIVGVPIVEGRTTYQSYILVPEDSSIQSFGDLRNRRFAFTDPLSNTGKLYPTYLLLQMGTTPEAFFASFTYTNSHDNSIQTVARRDVDGASVDSLIYKQLMHDEPDLTAQVRIIHRSPPMGMPPVVFGPTVPESLKVRVRRFFLDLHEDARGRRILDQLGIERFTDAAESDYDRIEQMRRLVKR